MCIYGRAYTGKTYLFKSVIYNFSNIDDYAIFNNNKVTASKSIPWAVSSNYNKVAYPDSLNALLEKLTVSCEVLPIVIGDGLYVPLIATSPWDDNLPMQNTIAKINNIFFMVCLLKCCYVNSCTIVGRIIITA